MKNISRISVFLLVILIGVIPYASGQTVVNGNISTRIDSLCSALPAGQGTDDYQAPTSGQLTQWGTVITKILQKDYSGANTDASALGYHIIQFIDTTTTPRVIYYILEKNSGSSNHWGIFVFNATPARPKIVIEAPHDLYDLNTAKQGRQIFLRNGARALCINGTHRCNSTSFSTCSGTTTTCSDTSEKYRLSDQAHTTSGTFQKTTEVMKSKTSNMFVIQPHGFSKDSDDPYAIMSNGTRYTPITDYLVMLRDNLLTLDGTLTFKLAHIDLSWTKLIATENTQGRLINGSISPCSYSASSTNGRFLHIEQAYSKLRDTENNRKKLSDAVGMTFPADTLRLTSPNGGETWQAGTNHAITWTSTGFIDTVKIEYSVDNGTTWNNLTSVPNSGTYTWSVSNAGSWRARVRISDVQNPTTSDFSSNPFTIIFGAWPISGTTVSAPIASAFGPRLLSGVYDFHRGIDMPDDLNTPVHPVKAGVIVRMEDTSVTVGTGLERYGNWILIQHESDGGSPRHTGYLHLNGFSHYSVGDTISTLDTIGFIGQSGVGINTVHLHLEYYKGLSGVSIDKDKIYNPFEILSYSDANGYVVTKQYQGDSTAVIVSVPSTELDFDEITMYGTLSSRTVAFNSRTGIDPLDNDNPLYNNVFIDPDPFTVDSTWKRYRFWTKTSEIGELDSITIKDLKGYTATVIEYSGQRYAVTSGNWDDAIWAGSAAGVAGSVPPPSQYDNARINSGVTVTVTSTISKCASITFQDNTASLALASGAILNVYGDFSIVSTSHKAFSSWAPGAKLRFTGSNRQTISGWSTSSHSADSTILMEVVVDKTGDTLKTPGTDMKLGLGTSLEIVRGIFALAYRDDINGRTLSGSTQPTITVDSAGVFTMYGSLSSIRSGTSGQGLIGKMTVKGEAHLASTSSVGICIDGIDVPSGGSLSMESFTSSYPNNILIDTVVISRGSQIYNNSTINFWGSSVVLYLDTGAVYKVTTATTNFPPVFYNKGTVRYQRTASDGSQTIADMNYFRLEISYSGTKTWILGSDRTIYDSLEINNSVNFVVTASSAHLLALKGTLRLSSGTLDNSSPNVNLSLVNGALISRATGTLSSAPTFGATVNVRYSSTQTSIATGAELPENPSVLKDVSILCDTTTVFLSTPVTINGTLTLSNGNFDNSSQVLTFAGGATIRRATGMLTAPPVFNGAINVAYISTLGLVTTGYELPASGNTIDTLSIQSPLGVTMNSDVTINKALELLKGVLYLGDSNLTLGASATLIGTPTDTTMIATSGTGSLWKVVSSAPVSFLLPIGDAIGGKHYSPVSMTISGVELTAGAKVGVRVIKTKHPGNLVGDHYLNRYWIITPSNISTITASLTFTYRQEDVHGDENSIVLGQWNGEGWRMYDHADTLQNRLMATVTSFSDFSGVTPAAVVSVVEGWNLLSVPVQAQNMDINSLFPFATSSAFGFHNGYFPAETLKHGVGYWVKFSEINDYLISGETISTDTIIVRQGWNMIGSLAIPVPTGRIVPVGTTISSNIFEYSSGYLVADTLDPGMGYWVKVSSDGVLILSSEVLYQQINPKDESLREMEKLDTLKLKEETLLDKRTPVK